MDVHIYSVKVNSHRGNICVYVMTTKKGKAARYSARDLRILLIFQQGALGTRRECCLGYISIFENTPEKLILKSIFPLKVAATLVVQGRTQLEHINHMVKVAVKLHANNSSPDRLRHMKNKAVQQLHDSSRNSEAIDGWKVARHPPSRRMVACDDYSFQNNIVFFLLQ